MTGPRILVPRELLEALVEIAEERAGIERVPREEAPETARRAMAALRAGQAQGLLDRPAELRAVSPG